MNLTEILNEQDWNNNNPDFKTKQKDIDKITGQVTWDVEYTPLKGVDDSIEKAYQDFKAVLRKYPQDPKLEKLFEVFSSFKRSYRTHVGRKYGK